MNTKERLYYEEMASLENKIENEKKIRKECWDSIQQCDQNIAYLEQQKSELENEYYNGL